MEGSWSCKVFVQDDTQAHTQRTHMGVVLFASLSCFGFLCY